MSDELPEHTGPPAQSPRGVLKTDPQLVQREARQISEFDMLELMPNVLLGINLRGVGRKVLYRHSPNGVQASKLFELSVLVDPRTVPHDEDALRAGHQKMTKEQDSTVRPNRRRMDLGVQVALQRQPSNDGQVLVRVGCAQHRSLPRRGPRLCHHRRKRKPRFVYEDDCSALNFSQFLNDRPVVCKPACEHGFILLRRAQYRLLVRPVLFMEQAGHVGRVIPDAKMLFDEPGYPGARPKLAYEAKACRTSLQQSHETTDLIVRKTTPLAFTGPGAERLRARLRSRFDPLADSSLGNAECFSDAHVEATLVGEVPKSGSVGLPSMFASLADRVALLNLASCGTVAPHDANSRALSYACKGQ